ncbi:hypothetical protein MYCTH_104005 [Thermothelomyces thermophilus ATCC 42464]|uniref:Uncharacterized protein n=1 Tax=Thermothelomyces thermophilus (strain ATCC 42464 / BCRC 31852 / DSM 1799) TaxID=573729 RepID=G2QN22_THET4|nr:uncharacterized protein MYCTH_104005 [Thermothelomyces thermophilus ATCC 42464]AEO61895.1 hypothetical protein MYCTH_104005 [Thermothelomyces thermophilus ATCC 42464]
MATTYLPRTDTGSTSPPRYTPQEQQEYELERLGSSSPSILSAPPPYTTDDAGADPSSRPFCPTVHLQIHTTGKSWFSLPLPPRPDPIPVFALPPDDPSSRSPSARNNVALPWFTSFRPERYSGSCYLQQSPAAFFSSSSSPSSSSSSSSAAAAGGPTIVATTTYRFGPGRPPVVRLFSPARGPGPDPATVADDDDDDNDNKPWDTFAVTSLGLLTRAVGFRSRLGTFQWRYAGRGERRAFARELSSSSSSSSSSSLPSASAGQGGSSKEEEADVANMLVLERVVRVAVAPAAADRGRGGGKREREEEVRTVVARFVRGDGFRTPGSGAGAAGNGGRLLVDLGLWEGGDGKGEREMALVMVVATCLLMLKREIDRRRAQQIAIMAGAGGGGGS